MTLDEFQKCASEGLVVECKTAQQRRDVLELFEESGFFLSPETKKYFRPESSANVTYMHPGYIPRKNCVTCYRNFEAAIESMKYGVRYEEIRDIIENPPPLDCRSDAEFANDFASLMC